MHHHRRVIRFGNGRGRDRLEELGIVSFCHCSRNRNLLGRVSRQVDRCSKFRGNSGFLRARVGRADLKKLGALQRAGAGLQGGGKLCLCQNLSMLGMMKVGEVEEGQHGLSLEAVKRWRSGRAVIALELGCFCEISADCG